MNEQSRLPVFAAILTSVHGEEKWDERLKRSGGRMFGHAIAVMQGSSDRTPGEVRAGWDFGHEYCAGREGCDADTGLSQVLVQQDSLRLLCGFHP